MEEQREATSTHEETPYLRQLREEREKRETHVKLSEEHADAIREIAEQAIGKHRVSLHLVAHAQEVGLLEEVRDEGERRRGIVYRLWYDFEKPSQRWCGWLGFTHRLELQLIDKRDPLHEEIYLHRD